MSRRHQQLFVLGIAVVAVWLAGTAVRGQAPPAIKVTRFSQNPLVTVDSSKTLGANVNGPTVIRVPDWVERPLGRYYMYFGNHRGDFIRLAYADAVTGPWKIHEPGVLHARDTAFYRPQPDPQPEVMLPGGYSTHLASPEILIDHDRKRIVMWTHGWYTNGERWPVGLAEARAWSSQRGYGQFTQASESGDGLHFTSKPGLTKDSYLRVFQHGGAWYGFMRLGQMGRAKAPLDVFELGGNPFRDSPYANRVRHVALVPRGQQLQLFFTVIGDAPERIMFTTIDLTKDWSEWRVAPAIEVMRPETDYECSRAPIAPSQVGDVAGRVHQMRDPHVFQDGGRTYLFYAVCGEQGVAAAEIVLPPAGQQPGGQTALAAIRAEGMGRSEAPRLFHTLTDVLGARLSGSPAHVAAARWAEDQLKRWGLVNARLEPFEFGRGWTLEKLTAEMTRPRYMPLLAYAEAWSPATAGVVSGSPIYVGDLSAEEIDRLGPRLRGAMVLGYRPQTEFLRADRTDPSSGSPVRTGNPPYPDASSATPSAQLLARLRAHGAGVVLRPGAMEHGTVRVQGNRATPADAVPSVVLAAEQYNMLVRLAQAGTPPQLRFEVGTRFEAGPNSYNVIAEIPGADPALRDEVVFVGAHLDSWHTATGATDNADGVVAVMEALRILTRLEARPRRTIRVALWSGEEQGLLGSNAHVATHLRDEAARSRISVYLNDDPGSGPTYGFYMQGNQAAKQIFDGWLEPLRDLGVRRNVIEGINATDHLAFDEAGIPAFTVIKDFKNYDTRMRHTNADFADAVSADDLKQSATVFASIVWQAATRDEKIPRKASK